jgi:hypothetical protein
MKKSFKKAPVVTLRDAYKVPGFRVSAQIDGYAELKRPAFVLNLKRLSKKRFAAAAKNAEAFMTDVVDACGISDAGIGTCISISRCAGLIARDAA